MGNRASVSFRNGNETSVALYNHWGGMEFVHGAEDYVRELRVRIKRRNQHGCMPIDRLEPATVMVDFIRHITKDLPLIEGTLYIAKDGESGDNSDNGHWIIDLKTGKAEQG